MLGTGGLRRVCGAQGHDCPVGALYPPPLAPTGMPTHYLPVLGPSTPL